MEYNEHATATVQVVSKDYECGFVVIDKADYDPAVHQLYEDSANGDKFDNMTAEQLRAFLTENKAEFNARDNKATLQELCRAVAA